MERLYDVEITGQLYEFLRYMRRCSGGLIGDVSLMFYRSHLDVRHQFLRQDQLREDLCRLRQYPVFRQRPFLISIESETQYFFLLTKSETPDLVYHYDENEETVQATAWTFNEYLKRIMQVEVPYYTVKDLVLTGEFIEI